MGDGILVERVAGHGFDPAPAAAITTCHHHRIELSFRPLRRDDFELLATWLARPHVERWWRHDPAAVEEDFGPGVDDTDPTEYFVVLADGEPLGLIQRYLLADNPDWLRALRVIGAPPDAFGIDYLIGDEAATGRGTGTAMIAAFLADSWARYPDASSAVVDVDPDNAPSWRALERNGFRRVWTGDLETDDPRDEGISHVYVLARPVP